MWVLSRLYSDVFQDYLSNPMFDSLHQQQRRRYWPGGASGGGIGGSGIGVGDTITLRPLSNLTKKNVMSAHRRLPMSKNSCKVL